MLKQIKEEAKTKEEALEKLLKNTNLSETNLFLNYEYVEGKLFKGSKYIVSALKKEDVKKFIEEFIKSLGVLMNINIDYEIIENENIYSITLISDNNAILIGKDGKTLNSIQLLIRQSLRNQTVMNIKINMDVANYKVKKMKNIEYEVKSIAKEVLSSKIDVTLDPMNSYERRLVHNVINEYKNLSTESVGEGKERHIIIKYVEEA